jgi:hypothetical protein
MTLRGPESWTVEPGGSLFDEQVIGPTRTPV